MTTRNIYRKLKGEIKIAHGPGCKSPVRQLVEMVQLIFRYHLSPDEYSLYAFYRKQTDYRTMMRYLTNSALLDSIFPRLNNPSWTHLLENKWLFHLYFGNLNIPVTNVFGIYHNRSGMTKTGARLRNKEDLKTFLLQNKPNTLVVKPVGGWQGINIIIIQDIQYGDLMTA
jgi:hypothetical protein